MKKLLLILYCLTLTGCAGPLILNNTFKCDKSKEEIQSELIKIATAEGLSLSNRSLDSNNIVMDFKMNNTSNHNISWNFLILTKENKIIAVPRIFNSSGEYNNGVHYSASSEVLGDDTPEKYTEYWNVRAKLEKFCGAKVKIVIEDANKKSLKEESLGR